MDHGVHQELNAQKPPRIQNLGDDLCGSATTQEKELWNGFCEIESEPVSCGKLAIVCLGMCSINLLQALFNVMLREFGVRGVKVQEIVSLDEDMMAGLR